MGVAGYQAPVTSSQTDKSEVKGLLTSFVITAATSFWKSGVFMTDMSLIPWWKEKKKKPFEE